MAITLSTLADATAQEIFDQVASHMLTQRKRSKRGGRCAYRGEHGLSCAAGCLIDNTEYAESMENRYWKELVDVLDLPDDHSDLIQDLQIIHDNAEPSDWEHELRLLAAEHDLKF